MSISNKKYQGGFTLVELSIVLIIIGILIGGVLKGMELVQNAKVNATVKNIQAIEFSMFTFKDNYRQLPGDLRSPSSILPGCTQAPCATSGDGNGIIGPDSHQGTTITASDENYVFWHHLQASNLVQLSIQNTMTMDYGIGSPMTPIGYGLRIADVGSINTSACGSWTRTTLYMTNSMADVQSDVDCALISRIDGKIDDGMPNTGNVNGAGYTFCVVGGSTACNALYTPVGNGLIRINLEKF